MFSHMNPKVDDKIKELMNYIYVKHGEFKSNKVKVHEYLGMTFDYSRK